jgi:hypothetical protein
MIRTATVNRQRRFAAFDVEMAAGQDAREYRPVGVACAAVWGEDMPRPVLWYGASPRGSGPTPHMSRIEVRRLVSYLEELSNRGYTLLTWNGMGFDWDLLATESLDRAACRQLALRHVDMMFHVACARGHRLSLERAARGMRLAGGMSGPNSTSALQLWAKGQYVAALGQLSHDVRLTLELADKCQEAGELRWESQSGRPASLPLPEGWLTVDEARRLPPPNVTGLDRRVCRASLTAWLRDSAGRRPFNARRVGQRSAG